MSRDVLADKLADDILSTSGQWTNLARFRQQMRVIQKQFDWSRISKMATSSGHTDYLHTPLPAGVLKSARECKVGDAAYTFGTSAKCSVCEALVMLLIRE